MNILENKRGLIFGALDERSLAWHVAEKCAEAGASFVLTNTEKALQIGNLRQLAGEKGWPLIACDATSVEDIEHLLLAAQEMLGSKLDFVLHAVAQSTNLRRHRSYDNLNYNYFHETLDTSALSLHKILQTAMRLDAIAEYGSVVTLSYMASERYTTGYGDMADAKAMLESIVRQMGAIYGKRKKVRINAISQSPTRTKAGGHWKEMEYFYRYTSELSPLDNADADDCGDLCVALFSDLMRKVTMQTIYNDGGFSRTALTRDLIDTYRGIEHPNI